MRQTKGRECRHSGRSSRLSVLPTTPGYHGAEGRAETSATRAFLLFCVTRGRGVMAYCIAVVLNDMFGVDPSTTRRWSQWLISCCIRFCGTRHTAAECANVTKRRSSSRLGKELLTGLF